MPNYEHLPIIDPVAIYDQSSFKKPRLVVVGSSEPGIGITEYLSNQLYEIYHTGTAQDLYDLLSVGQYDVVILDIKVPDSDNITLIRELSSRAQSFHLFVRSETDDEVDTVLALELGADECIPKSCGVREVKARVRALLRRRMNDAQRLSELSVETINTFGSQISYQGWILNRDKCQLYTPTNHVISLTSVEYGILISLFTEPGATKDRSSLRSLENDSSEYEVRSLDVFVSRLRKKLAQYGGQHLIETVRGRGYRLASTMPSTGR